MGCGERKEWKRFVLDLQIPFWGLIASWHQVRSHPAYGLLNIPLCLWDKVHFFFFFLPHRAACGISVLQTWIQPMPPAVEALGLNCWTMREVLVFDLAPIYLSRFGLVLPPCTAFQPQATAKHSEIPPGFFWFVLSLSLTFLLDFQYGFTCYLQREVLLGFPRQSQASVTLYDLGCSASTGEGMEC